MDCKSIVHCCRLCGSGKMTFIGLDNHGKRERRAFYLCGECGMVSVPQQYWMSLKDEKARYSCHDNHLHNIGYCRFLSETAASVTVAINYAFPNRPKNPPTTIKLLDFGCGKNAVLGQVLKQAGTLTERGIDYHTYDPLYDHLPLPNPSVGKFDIIVACEVVEHLRDIRGELTLMGSLLKENGTIILRTTPYPSTRDFPRWHYASDPTHINFFNQKSIRLAATILGRQVTVDGGGESNDFFLLK